METSTGAFTLNKIITYQLSQNYPNPFNPETRIDFAVPADGMVSLKVYNLLGEEIVTLVNEVKQPGNYSVGFNAAQLSSGIYYYGLKVKEFSSVKKMVVLK